MEVFIAQVINGLSLGSILRAPGHRVQSPAPGGHDHPLCLSSGGGLFHVHYLGCAPAYGKQPFPGCPGCGPISILLNLVSAPLFQKVMKKRGEVDINTTMVLSLGIGMIITDLLSHGFNKGFPIAFPDELSGKTALLRVGLISILPGQVSSLIVGIIAVSGFFLLLYKTRAGRAFRASRKTRRRAPRGNSTV